MKQLFSGSGVSLLGVAVLAACACGTSSSLTHANHAAGHSLNQQVFYLPFVVLGASLIVYGLWQKGRSIGITALVGAALLIAGGLLAEEMAITPSTSLTNAQIAGLFAYVAAGVVLVKAFYRAFPSEHPRASMTAMGGMALATGCSCCLVTMGVTALAVSVFPSQPWLGSTEAAYIPAAVLMAIGLGRIGGVLPAIAAVGGEGVIYYGLRMAIPGMTINGMRADYLAKYPTMLIGSLVIMGAFAFAYRPQEETSFASEPAVAGD